MDLARLVLTDARDENETFGVEGARRYTRKETLERTYRLANALLSLGIGKKDKVAIMAYNGNEFMETLLASSILGAIMIPVNWHFRGRELSYCLGEKFSPKVLILDPEFLPFVEKIKPEIPNITHFILIGDEYESLLDKSSPTPPRETGFFWGLMPFTAGTTGLERGVNFYDLAASLLCPSEFGGAIRVRNAEKRAELLFDEIKCVFYNLDYWRLDEVKALISTPMYHIGSLLSVIPGLVYGGSFVYMRKFDPEDFLSLIEKERATFSFVVPTVIQRVLSLPEEVKSKYDLSSIKVLLSGAASCPVAFKKRINELFIKQGAKGSVFYELYGSSEAGAISTLNPRDYFENEERYKSVGKTIGARTRLIDHTLFVQNVFTSAISYVGEPDKTETLFRDGFLDEGIYASQDSDDFLYVGERKKDMLKSGGVNIPAREVEEAILEHPGVEDVAIIGAPDEEWGEKVMAVVQLKKGESVTEGEIIDFTSQRLSSYKKPRIVKFVPELPRRDDGKMIKRELREMFFGEKAWKK